MLKKTNNLILNAIKYYLALNSKKIYSALSKKKQTPSQSPANLLVQTHFLFYFLFFLPKILFEFFSSTIPAAIPFFLFYFLFFLPQFLFGIFFFSFFHKFSLKFGSLDTLKTSQIFSDISWIMIEISPKMCNFEQRHIMREPMSKVS